MAEDRSVHELLVQLKHGNNEAWGTLFTRYTRRFYAYARSRGLIHEDADDIVQDFFIWKLPGDEEKKKEGSIVKYDETNPGGAAWLWRTFIYYLIDRARQIARSAVSIEVIPEEDFASIDADPALWVEKVELYVARYLAWEHLSQADRDLLSQVTRGRRSKEKQAAVARFKVAIETWYNKNIQ